MTKELETKLLENPIILQMLDILEKKAVTVLSDKEFMEIKEEAVTELMDKQIKFIQHDNYQNLIKRVYIHNIIK